MTVRGRLSWTTKKDQVGLPKDISFFKQPCLVLFISSFFSYHITHMTTFGEIKVPGWLATLFSCIVCLCVCVGEGEVGGWRLRCVVGGPVIKSHYCNWKLKSHLFSPLVLTVTTKTGVLLQKLTFGISVKGHAREHQLIEKAASQTIEAGEIIYYREFVCLAQPPSTFRFSGKCGFGITVVQF